MFHQIVTPAGGGLLLSFALACIPIGVVLFLLGIKRRPAWQASVCGLFVALALAVFVWKLPIDLALSSIAAGATFALWPIMWIVFNALLLYNIAVVSGRFAMFRDWMVAHLPNDSRVVLVVVGFSFGCLLEGISGFGTPIAITSALLVALNFQAKDAIVFSLMFNTAPVAFGALGAPVTTLAAVTQLSDTALASMIGRQLPLIALLLPFYVVAVFAGFRAIRGIWPVLLVAGSSFATVQFISSNYLGYALTDVLSSLASLIATLIFVKAWKMNANPAFALRPENADEAQAERQSVGWHGWLPWLVLCSTVIVWVHLKVNLIGEFKIEWPGLHNRVFVTTYGKPYAAIWNFQPLSTGTAILVATGITAVLLRLRPVQFREALFQSIQQIKLPLATTMLIVGLAYLMNYSGIAFTLGVGIASVGFLFPLVSAMLGWLAVFLSGSDTSGNALFGNLQVVAARELGLSPVLMAATNASGGVMGKMISPQNISTGTATTDCRGQEGAILACTFKHSVALTLLLGILVMAQQFLFPGLIPH